MRYRKDVLIARLVFVLMIALVIGIIVSVVSRISAGKNNQQVAEVVEETEQVEQVEIDDSEFAEIIVESDSVEEESFVKTTAQLNFRKEPNPEGTFISVIPEGTELPLLGEDDGWCKVTYNNQEGYVSSNYVVAVTVDGEDADITPMITTTSVRMRSGAGSEYTLICDIAGGTEVSVFEISNGWAKIYYNEKTGYVSAQYLKDKE